MESPLLNRIGSIFIPVSDVVKARAWYRSIFGIEESPEIQFGHLCVIPLEGNDIILDQMPMWRGQDPGGPPKYEVPAFTFLAPDIGAAYAWLKNHRAHLVTDIQHDQWFVFKDPDGNMLMVCKS